MKRTPSKRKNESKTDYDRRLKLLKSGLDRVVIRIKPNNTICQVESYDEEGDETVASGDSLQLKALGWKGHRGNIPASYLVGYLCGVEAKEEGVEEAVLDTGLEECTEKGRLYATLKGFVDSGVEVSHDDSVLPSEDRIKGNHISEYAQKLKGEDEEFYKKKFSRYLDKELKPEDIQEHFEDIKEKIKGVYENE